MLKIRKDQKEAMDEVSQERFRRRLLVELRREFPAETGDQDEIESYNQILDCEERARRFGICTQSGITRYARLSYREPGFDRDPDFKRAMRKEGCDPEAQLELIDEGWAGGRWRDASD